MSKKNVWVDSALSIPLENGWTLDLQVWEDKYTDNEGTKNETTQTVRYVSWELRHPGNPENGEPSKIKACDDKKAQTIIDYIVGRMARIGGPYR